MNDTGGARPQGSGRRAPNPDKPEAAQTGQAKPEAAKPDPDKQEAAKRERVKPEPALRSCPIVGVGASAGGLEAFSVLLDKLPVDTGMAFVFFQHLDPHHPSLLSHLLAARTPMPVVEATDGVRVAPDHVYVVPPGSDMTLEAGRLRLTPRHDTAGLHLPIDAFLRSLASDLHELACAVLLSGAGSDGTQGLVAVKSEGGVTFAQEPASADYPSMPAAAIAARVVDFVLPPEQIAAELARLGGGGDSHLGAIAQPAAGVEADDTDGGDLDQVFALLRRALGVDFSAYKLPTIRRRLARRMLLRRTDDLREYVDLLREDPAELEALYRDILIMVTEFFRDPETFALLREAIFPEILDSKDDGDSVRIWVPGCASGEEAYSLAITALDVMAARGRDLPVKIFATDINEPDLERARRGSYAESISGPVPAALLRRYFVAIDGGYQVNKAVRELCVFARHDLTADPPFPRLDLVSCRNLLIYLGPALQRRAIASMHYGLLPKGYLVLGRSESIGGSARLFDTVDKAHRVFCKLPSSVGALIPALPGRRPGKTSGAASSPVVRNLSLPPADPGTRELADKAVLAAFGPAGVTVDAQYGIVEFRGDTGPYLANRPGRPSLNLLDTIRDDLAGSVRTALAEAARTGTKVVLESVHTGKGRSRRVIDLHVMPFMSSGAMHYVVLFRESARPAALQKGESARVGATEAGDVQRLHDELNATRERLEAVIQAREAANEELRAANEEMLSSGEEMQSANEELETTHEELQSTNQELRSRNAELGQLGDDLANLLASVSFPIIMVDRALRIRRFTPAAEHLFNMIHSDIGRPITDLRLPIGTIDLTALLGEVIETVSLKEREIQDDQGRWYVMQARPYTTSDRRIDGAVMTMFDINELTRRYEVQRHIAVTLQENFIHELPAVAGLELGVVAKTAYEPDLVGGDFNDVFVLDDKRVVVLVGDVAGKGVRAAGLTETVRSQVRAFATIDPSPAFILAKTNELLIRFSTDDLHVTAVLGVLDPRTGRLSYASAGHPAPIHVGASVCRPLEMIYGPPLGSFAEPYHEAHVVLALDDYLVLYTDGVTEARRGVSLFGEERLVEATCGLVGRSAQQVADGVADAALAFGGRLRDDLQVVVLRLT